MKKCDGCGKAGKPRNPDANRWACSAECAQRVMKLPEWRSIGWLKC